MKAAISTYITKHDIDAALTEALNAVLKQRPRPENPLAHIAVELRRIEMERGQASSTEGGTKIHITIHSIMLLPAGLDSGVKAPLTVLFTSPTPHPHPLYRKAQRIQIRLETPFLGVGSKKMSPDITPLPEVGTEQVRPRPSHRLWCNSAYGACLNLRRISIHRRRMISMNWRISQ